MIHLTHVALYTRNLEQLREFYTRYFEAVSNEKYLNPRNEFASYFLSFGEGAQLEIMQKEAITAGGNPHGNEKLGLTHLALAVGSREQVDQLTERLRADGYPIVGEPRTTGDGYYESVILDPDGNRVELVAG